MNITTRPRVSNARNPRATVLDDLKLKMEFWVEEPVGGETLFRVASEPFLDEDNENAVTIDVYDSRGQRRAYATWRLGLTSDRYGEWRNIAHVL